MKKLAISMVVASLLSTGLALAAESQRPVKQAPAAQQAATKKPVEKQKAPGTMEKAGNSLKSGWNRFTDSVKHGRKQPLCTAEQKSLKQCG